MVIYGNPIPTIQGGVPNLQGSSPTLQPAGNPQQAAPVYGPPAPAPIQPRGPAAPAAPAPRISTSAAIQVARPDTQINSIFSQFIGSRPSASNPGVLEYYNKQTGQGFSNPQDLYNFASSLGAGTIGSFDQLHAPVQSGGFQAASYGAPPPQNQNQQIASGAGTAGLSVD